MLLRIPAEIADNTFLPIIPRCPWTGGDNCGAAMLRHFLVGFVQNGLRAGILDDAGLEIVRGQDSGDSTEIVVGMNMSCDPCFLLHVEERFRIPFISFLSTGLFGHCSV